MAQQSERAVLNHLIETCRDAERGFRTAAEHVNTAQLRTRFLKMADQRRQFADALLPHAQRLGGADVSDGTSAASVHRAWIHLKASITADPNRAVLREAARGERFAVAAYDGAIHDILPPDVRDLIEEQEQDVRSAALEIQTRAGYARGDVLQGSVGPIDVSRPGAVRSKSGERGSQPMRTGRGSFPR